MHPAQQPSPPTRWKSIAIALCAATALSAALPPGASLATSSQEQQLHGMLNQARSDNGVGPLGLSQKLSRRAHGHSERMADSGRLFHSCLNCRGRRSRMGENVGVADSIREVHRMLMNSSSHRANILGPGFERVGVGVVRKGGRVWVTEIFAG